MPKLQPIKLAESERSQIAEMSDKLGIDFEAVKKALGKPSDVFFEHFEKLRTENEQHQIDNASLNFQLAEAQLENQALRGYLEKIQKIASPYRDGVKFNYITDICQEALSQTGVGLGDIGALEVRHANGAPAADQLSESHESATVTAPARKKPGS